jgi:4-hydroxy-tetrahydrodipicolinate reductase
MSVKLAVSGATGRMGHTILQLAALDGRFLITGALESPTHPMIGKSICDADPSLAKTLGTPIVEKLEDLKNKPDILIDFSMPIASLNYLTSAKKLGIGLVVGTTGLNPDEKKMYVDASKKIPVLLSPNMGVGMNLLFTLVEEAARKLGPEYDVEIIEAHHNLKKDAPSGSALGLGEAVSRAWGQDLDKISTHGRKGKVGERVKGTIGFHAVRGGDIVGDHTVLFAGPGERLELTHRAASREAFARGALKAALFLSSKKDGFYEMRDVLI